MFAGEFAAGATTLKSDGQQINLGAVRVFAGALHFAPQNPVVVARGSPESRVGQLAAGLQGGRVGSQLGDLCFGEAVHVCALKCCGANVG